MRQELERHRESLTRLRRRVLALRSDLELQQRGGQLFYAVDFSEVHAWIYDDQQLLENDEVGLGVEDRDKQSLQRRLGLTHLFRSFAADPGAAAQGRLYLLPAHLQELTSFVRGQQQQLEQGRKLREAALRWTEHLDPRDKLLLEALGGGATLDKDDLGRMLALVEGGFDELCEKVDTFVGWYDRHSALQRLRELVAQHRLSYQPPVTFPTPAHAADDEALVFGRFSEDKRRQNRFAKRLDARALVYLRDANRHLASRNARLLLVTRDQSIRHAAASLDGNAAFHGIGDHLRSIETVLLDLTLRGKSGADERLAWLGETDLLLERMHVAVDQILRRTEGTTSSLAHSGERVLAEAWELWYGHLNLRLSLAVPSVPWLLEGFALGDKAARADGSGAPPADVDEMEREQRLLRNLGSFIASDRYRALASDTLDELWRDLTVEGMRMLFLGCLGERTDDVIDLFAETLGPSEVAPSTPHPEAGHSPSPPRPAARAPSAAPAPSAASAASTMLASSAPRPRRTMLRSRRNATFGSLQFVTPQYRDKMSRLKPWYSDEREHFEQLRHAFYEVVAEATTGRSVPEDFLFMGFVLAMVDQWESARDLARHAVALARKSADPVEQRQAEAHYFLAVADRVIATGHEVEDLRGLSEAYRHMRLAYDENGRGSASQDPRYMKELGTIALLIHHAVGHARGVAGPALPGLLDEAEAIALMEKALELSLSSDEGADRRLRIELLNNLAYVTTSGGRLNAAELARAESWVTQMEKEFEEARQDRTRSLPEQPWPAIRDTQLMVRGLGARIRSDGPMLAWCLGEFDALLGRDDLSPTQRRAVGNHREQVRGWVESLERR